MRHVGAMNDAPSQREHQPATARRWSLRTLAATAITAVALSGAGGAALAVASDGASSGGRPGGPPPGMTGKFKGHLPNGAGQRPGVPGQLPSATDPAKPNKT